MPAPNSSEYRALPSELTDRVIDFLHADLASLRACARVHSSWMPAARMHLYERVYLASLGPWLRLVETLTCSPAIIPLVKHLAINGQRGFLEYVADEAAMRLGVLLAHVPSLDLIAISIRKIDDRVGSFLRRNFLHVRRLRLDAVSAKACHILQEVCLDPRTELEFLALSHSTVSSRIGPMLDILKYPQLELDRFALRTLVDFQDTTTPDETVSPTLPSSVRRLRLPGLQLENFSSVIHTLGAIGTSLQTLEIRMRGQVTQSYPSFVTDVLEYNTQLETLEWHDVGSSFVQLPQDLADVLAHASTRSLQEITLHLDPQGSDALLDEARVSEGWAPFAQALGEDVHPALRSLRISYVSASDDHIGTLRSLLPMRLDTRIWTTSSEKKGPS